MATKGYAAPEVEQAYTRARELCQQVGETPQLFPVLWGLWLFYLVRAEYRRRVSWGSSSLSLAQSVQDPALLLEAHHALWAHLVLPWRVGLCPRAPEQGIALYDPQQHRSLAFLYVGMTPEVAAYSYAAWALWLLGYPDQALKRSHEALTLAQELSHPFSLAYALDLCCHVPSVPPGGAGSPRAGRGSDYTLDRAGVSVLVGMGDYPAGLGAGRAGTGRRGDCADAPGPGCLRATGAELYRPYFLALLAEAYGKVGQAEEGLTVLAEALAIVRHYAK